MDVVVDQPVAVLKILTFGDAICGDEQVEITFIRECTRSLFRFRCERSENRG